MIFTLTGPRHCWLVAIAAAVLLPGSGCSTVADGTWHEPRTTNAPFDDVLIVAVVSYKRMRRDLEKLLVTDITASGSNATSSLAIESNLKHAEKSPESVLAMIEDTDADAVLVLRIVDQTATETKTPATAYVNVGPQVEIIKHPHVTEVWAGNYSVHQAEGQLVFDTDTVIEALVYDIADHNRVVYTIEAETKYQENGGDTTFVISDNVANAVTHKLRQAGLIR